MRGKGLASVLMALWLQLCMELELTPATKRIDKPVISLMLHKFGFSAANTNTSMEVSSEHGENGEVILWSPDPVQLRSTFSKRYLKAQNMVVASERPAKSQTVCVNTAYDPPHMEVIRQHIDSALKGKELHFYTDRDGQGLAKFLLAQIAHPWFQQA